MSSDEIRNLCDWFLTYDRALFPQIPFKLTEHQTVTGQGFFDVLTREAMNEIDYLSGDRTNPSVRLASLLKDLKALQSLTQLDDDTDW